MPPMWRFLAPAALSPTAGIVKGYRMSWAHADTDRTKRPGGMRPGHPIRLEGGNRGEVRDDAEAGLWWFEHRESWQVGGVKLGAAGIR